MSSGIAINHYKSPLNIDKEKEEYAEQQMDTNEYYQIIQQLYTIINDSINECKILNTDKEKINYLNQQMYIVDALLEKNNIFKKEAKIYFDKRNEFNDKIKTVPQKIIKQIETELYGIKIKTRLQIMSSFSSNTNLMDESDIDIGLLVEDLNKSDYKMIIEEKLIKMGYKYHETRNENEIKKRYYSYNKFINVTINGCDKLIEIEVKVRDLVDSKQMIELHNNLDTKLTIIQQMLYTYIKLILKPTDKKTYSNFKKLMQNSFLINVKDAYALAV